MVFQCDVCSRTYAKSRHLRLHFARQHTDKKDWTHKCERCGKVYADAEILERHHETHSLKVSCPIQDCSEVFASFALMHKHRRLKHFLPSDEIEEATLNKKKKKYSCDKCDASFSKHHLLTQHTYTHTGVLPFSCGKCDKSFSTLAHRNRHEKVHDGYKCLQCCVVFETWSKLRHHMSIEHPRAHKCMKCDKVFSMACRLQEHLEVHSSERNVYKCVRCDKTFVKKYNLKTHVKAQHLNIKKFVCSTENCGKSFAYKHTLEKHMKIHSPGYIRVYKKSGKKKISLVSRITGFNPTTKTEVAVVS